MLNLPDAPTDGQVFSLAKCDLVWNATPQGRWRRQSIYQLSALDPAFVMVYGATFTLTLNGSGFTADSDVMFDGALVATTFVSSKRLTIEAPGSNAAKKFDVWVVDPIKGATAKLPFEYRDYLQLYAISPDGAATNTAQTFSCLGSGYTPNSVINLDGVALATTYVSSYQLSASAPISTTIKTVPCTVTEGIETTTPKDFRYIAPLPAITLTSISPPSNATNDSSSACYEIGTGFTADCDVYFGDVVFSMPSLISPTQLSTSIPASNTVKTVQVYVKGIGRQSNAIAFSYTSATAPVLTMINPNSILAGGQSHLINLQGSNFDADAKVYWDGVVIPSTRIDATRLDVTITAPIVGTSKTTPVKVENPDTAESSATLNFNWTAVDMVPADISLIPNYMVKYFSGEWEVVVQSNTNGQGSFTGDAVCHIDGVPQRTVFYSPGTLRFYCIGSDWPLNMTNGYPFTVVQRGGTSAPIPFYCVQ
jgi:hypothetical protein